MKKRNLKRSCLLLFSVLLFYPISEVNAADPVSDINAINPMNGVTPDNSPAIEQPSKAASNTRNTLPTVYDPRTTSNIPLKNQQSLDICWAFASNAALEHHYYKKTGIWLPLSETYNDYLFARNATSLINENKFAYNRDLGQSGQEIATFYGALRWKAPVLESDMPLQLAPKPIALKDLDKPTPYHVQGTVDIPKLAEGYTELERVDRVQEIKKEILNNGGVTFRNDGNNLLSTNKNYNLKTSAYFTAKQNNPNPINHVCLIVGWNDNYDKNNFSTVPSSNGAFIVKNSWGTSRGDAGYFYVSYEDYHLMTTNSHGVTSIEKSDNYMHQYSTTDFATPNTASGYNVNAAQYYLSNHYDAPKDHNETIKAVGIRTLQYNTPYEIYLNPNGTDNSDLTKLKKVAEGVREEIIRLKESIPIYSKDKFSVVIKFKRPAGVSIAYFPPEPTWLSDNVTVSNQSFYASGISEISLTFKNLDYDFYIHVYTDDVAKLPEIAPESLELREQQTVMAKGGTQQILAVIMPNHVSDKTIVWSSSNPSILEVSANVTVKATGIGRATITAKMGQYNIQASKEIIVNDHGISFGTATPLKEIQANLGTFADSNIDYYHT